MGRTSDAAGNRAGFAGRAATDQAAQQDLARVTAKCVEAREIFDRTNADDNKSVSSLATTRLEELDRQHAALTARAAEFQPGGTPEASENGVHFATGVPVKFDYIRKTFRAHAPKDGSADPEQQRIEPLGRYMAHDTAKLPVVPNGWKRGRIAFKNPLVLRDTLDDSLSGQFYGPDSWKARLSDRYGGLKGKKLAKALAEDGHDGIVTVDRHGNTGEIVDLAHLPSGARNGSITLPDVPNPFDWFRKKTPPSEPGPVSVDGAPHSNPAATNALILKLANARL